MSKKLSLEELFAQTTPQITAEESTRMLAAIETAVLAKPLPSPYFSYYFSFKPLSYIALSLVLLLGATGTVAASGAAKPGDLLFPIERATEQVRIAFAPESEREALHNQFMSERFVELHEIITEETAATSTGTTTTGVTLRAEGESRVANAVAVLANQLAHESDSDTREQFLQDLLDAVDSLHVAGRDNASVRLDAKRVKIDDTHTAVRTTQERINIEQKDGPVEIKFVNRDRGHSDDEQEKDSKENATTTTVQTEKEQTGTTKNQSTDTEELLKGVPTPAVELHAQFDFFEEGDSNGQHNGNGNSSNNSHGSEKNREN